VCVWKRNKRVCQRMLMYDKEKEIDLHKEQSG